MKTYVFDIDGTICFKVSDGNYNNSVPIKDRINTINKLYNSGSRIVLYTARGMGRYNNDLKRAYEEFYDLTVKQLKSWNVKYHDLFLGKPAGDLYVDDKGRSDREFFKDDAKDKT